MTTLHTETKHRWTFIRKFFVLLPVTYFLLYMFPFPINVIVPFYTDFIDYVTLWIGKNLLEIESLTKIEMTGSGDTTYDYVKLLTIALLTIIATCSTLIFTKKYNNYTKFYNLTIIYARYYLGLYMLSYGFAKIYDGQFPFPTVGRLEQAYGNSSPMGLLWTFMGASKSYTVFSGLGEILGGALLLFRRTTVIGCLISLIVMLNFSYDVPVKIFSSHLVLISIFILTPFIGKLYDSFILHKLTEIAFSKLILPEKWLRVGRIILKSLILIAFPILTLIQIIQSKEGEKNKLDFNGMYKADIFIANNDTLPPLTTDTLRWKQMSIQEEYVKVTTMADSSVRYFALFDSLNKVLRIKSMSDTSEKYSFVYTKHPTTGYLTISGLYKRDSIFVSFKRKTLQDYLLVNRGFHWISEYPYNR